MFERPPTDDELAGSHVHDDGPLEFGGICKGCGNRWVGRMEASMDGHFLYSVWCKACFKPLELMKQPVEFEDWVPDA